MIVTIKSTGFLESFECGKVLVQKLKDGYVGVGVNPLRIVETHPWDMSMSMRTFSAEDTEVFVDGRMVFPEVDHD